MKHWKRPGIVAVAAALALAVGIIPASAIVGGTTATRPYPGLAAVDIIHPGLGVGLCGGTMITSRWLLTAAHCVSDQTAAPKPVAVPADGVSVRVGSTDRSSGGQVVTGKQVYLHPGWAWGAGWPSSPVADLALVELADALSTPLVQLDSRPVPASAAVRLVGWGLTQFPPAPGATPPLALHQRDTTVLALADCSGGFAGAGEICVGAGACYGDSGGPALRQDIRADWVWTQVGVASRETNLDSPCGQTTVFTDPAYPEFRSWIWTTVLTRRQAPCLCPPAAASGGLVDRLKLRVE